MRRDQHQRLINCSLVVLDEACGLSAREAVATPAVRLALRVLLLYVADRAPLVAFWERAQAKAPHPWATCREPYHMIRKSLREAGWAAPA